jgi:hypothetical protein
MTDPKRRYRAPVDATLGDLSREFQRLFARPLSRWLSLVGELSTELLLKKLRHIA